MSCKNHKKGYKLALINKNNMKFNIVKGVVSILTPAYNSEKFINRLLDSVLSQDYPYIEMIVVDDGSIDRTKDIVESYIPRFLNKGFSLLYIYQTNSGQAAAINTALKTMTGEYFIWPDSDDYFSQKYSISTLVSILNSSDSSYGIARCQCNFIDESNGQKLPGEFKYTNNENLFFSFLSGEEFGGGSGAYMICTEVFDKAYPDRNIYTERHPQNCQLLEPVFYLSKCITTHSKLINILVRSNSHSRFRKSYEDQLDDIDGYIDIHKNTLENIPNMSYCDKIKYIKIVKNRYIRDKFTLAVNHNNKGDAKYFYKELKKMNAAISTKMKLKLISLYFPQLIRFINYIKRI